VIPANPQFAQTKAVQRQLRVAAYCRVSTDSEEQLTSYEAQKNYYRAWVRPTTIFVLTASILFRGDFPIFHLIRSQPAPAVRAEQQPGKQGNPITFSGPMAVLAVPPYHFPYLRADQRLMGVLKNHLLFLRIVDDLVTFEGFLRGLKVDGIQQGVDAKTVSSILGHYSAGFTLDTYAHVTSDMQRDAAQKMGSFMVQAM